jgi:hypothetical protein
MFRFNVLLLLINITGNKKGRIEKFTLEVWLLGTVIIEKLVVARLVVTCIEIEDFVFINTAQ